MNWQRTNKGLCIEFTNGTKANYNNRVLEVPRNEEILKFNAENLQVAETILGMYMMVMKKLKIKNNVEI